MWIEEGKIVVQVDSRGDAWDFFESICQKNIDLNPKMRIEFGDSGFMLKNGIVFQKVNAHEDIVILKNNLLPLDDICEQEEVIELGCVELKLSDFAQSITQNTLSIELNNFYAQHTSPIFVYCVPGPDDANLIPKFLSDCDILGKSITPKIFKTIPNCIKGVLDLIHRLAEYSTLPEYMKHLPVYARDVKKQPILGLSHAVNGLTEVVAHKLLVKHKSIRNICQLEVKELEASLSEIVGKRQNALSWKIYKTLREGE